MSARSILAQAESYDRYCSACDKSVLNRLARKNDKYLPYFLPEDEANRLRSLVGHIELLNESDIIILHSSADNGYPHTRPREVVCLPESAVVGVSADTLRNTLCHEAMHIHQRRYPGLWKQMCMKEGWKPISEHLVPQRFREQCRINPDTFYADQFWAWDSYHVPLPMFKNESPSGLGDVRIEWLDTRTGAIFHDPPSSFTKKYGSPSQPEHPYEIYAVKYADEGLSSSFAVNDKLAN